MPWKTHRAKRASAEGVELTCFSCWLPLPLVNKLRAVAGEPGPKGRATGVARVVEAALVAHLGAPAAPPAPGSALPAFPPGTARQPSPEPLEGLAAWLPTETELPPFPARRPK